MDKIVKVIYNISTENKECKVVYSKKVEDEMLLISTCLFKDNLGSKSIIRSVSDSDNIKKIIENTNLIDKAFLLTISSSENPIENDYVFYCYLDNIRFIYIPFKNTDETITLTNDDNEILKEINIKESINSSVDIKEVTSIAGFVLVTESENLIDNIGYRVHEIIDFPHRNLRESTLYSEEIDKYIGQDIILKENDYYKDKRSKIFISESFEEV